MADEMSGDEVRAPLHPSTERLLKSCVQQFEVLVRGILAGAGGHAAPTAIECNLREALTVSNAELVTAKLELKEACEELIGTAAELDAIKQLSKRASFSETDPVCKRCMDLAATVDKKITGVPCGDGVTCSRCGAIIVVRQPGESHDGWMRRYQEATAGWVANRERIRRGLRPNVAPILSDAERVEGIDD